MHTIARVGLFALAMATAMATGAQDRVGERAAGSSGGTRTTADIMAQQASALAVTTTGELRPRLRLPSLRRVNPSALPDRTPSMATKFASGLAPKVAQSPTVNFLGARLSDSGSFPPDTMGAAGPSQFIVVVNGRIRTFDKLSGTQDGILDVTTDIFFKSVLTPLGGPVTSNAGASKPSIRYDRSTSRWYVVMIDTPLDISGVARPNRVMIAVSDTAAISTTTKWTYFFFTPSVTYVGYIWLGIDSNALYIGSAILNLARTAFLNTDAYVVQKSSVLGAGPIVATVFAGLISDINCTLGSDNGPAPPTGVDNVNPSSEGYLIGPSACNAGQLVMRRVSNPGTGAPTISGNILITVANFLDVDKQPHLGNTRGSAGYLDAFGADFKSAQIRNGVLYTAHAIAVDATGAAVFNANIAARNGVRWYQLNSLTGAPGVLDFGTVFDNSVNNPQMGFVRWYSSPSAQVNGQGHMAIGFTRSGPFSRADAGWTGRLVTDAPGATDVPQTYTSTSAAYNAGPTDPSNGTPWGNHSYTSVDPNDDQTMWTIQEYAENTNSWGVRVARLLAPPPATPTAYSFASIPANTPSTTFTLTGTSAGGSGFFDSGPGFANRQSVEIPGVTVTGVTYVSPTQLTVTVSTMGSTPGNKSVRVINPDGQYALDSGLLFIVSGSTAPLITSANSLVCAVGAACNFTFTTLVGVTASTFTATGTLPSGVTFATPTLSGTPAVGTQGTYTLTVTASNGSLPDAVQTFTLIVTTTCGGFTDVTGADIYCNQTEWLKNRGVTLGCTATAYCPGAFVTRGAMALFMQRLGDAIAPTAYSDNVLQSGLLTLDARPGFCTTANFPAVNFPRVAWITWSFNGYASAPLTARVFSQTNFATSDTGANYSTNETSLMRVQAQGSGYVGTSATVKVNVPAGASPRFRLRTDRELGTTTSGNFQFGRCNIGVLFISVNGGASPYDSPVVQREEP